MMCGDATQWRRWCFDVDDVLVRSGCRRHHVTRAVLLRHAVLNAQEDSDMEVCSLPCVAPNARASELVRPSSGSRGCVDFLFRFFFQSERLSLPPSYSTTKTSQRQDQNDTHTPSRPHLLSLSLFFFLFSSSRTLRQRLTTPSRYYAVTVRSHLCRLIFSLCPYTFSIQSPSLVLQGYLYYTKSLQCT